MSDKDDGHISPQLIAEPNDRVRELGALNRISVNVNSTLELDRVLDLVVREAKDILGVESCSLALVDEQNNDLVFKVGFGLPEGEARQIRLSVDQGIVGWVAREGRPALVNDVLTDPRWCGDVDKVTGFRTRSIAAFPVVGKDKVIGVLEVINKIQGRFAEHDLQLLQSISTSVSTAIQNARLFGELNQAYSELERIHHLVLESRNTLRALIDGIPDSIWIVDRSFKVTSINRTAAQRMGLSPAQCIGQQCYAIVRGGKVPCNPCPAQETFANGNGVSIVETVVKGDGSKRDYEVRTYPMRNGNTQVDKVIHIVQDITARRRMEAALLQSARLSAVGELAAGVAHDISNPMTAVIANSQMLLQDLKINNPHRELAELIERAAKRSQKAVRKLLDLSHQDDCSFDPTDLNATIEEVLSLISVQFSRRGIRVKKNLGELPLIHASASHLNTVWTNLLINARDAITKERPGEIEIATQLNPRDQSVQIVISDNGAGIAERDIDRIFEPFFTSKARDQGTGLGLYISRVIVAQHMGTIEVASKIGQGTTFTVTLPVDGPSEEHTLAA